MDMPGPVAPLGGGENRPGTDAIERSVLEVASSSTPRVTVLPAASSRRQVGMVAALARNHWARLGASVRIVLPGAVTVVERTDASA